ncbi:MAG: Holliday junction branch migration protein RuvA [Myxococcota bacterium]
MIGRLDGLVVERGADGSCVLDVRGVGYEVFVPLGALGRLPQPPDSVVLHVHTHVREDSLVLYGFPSSKDREAFRTVLSVSGVGPKLALAILSHLTADQLAQAIAMGDKAALKGISGVGRKTVERLMLELRDKLPTVVALQDFPTSTPVAAAKPTGPLATVAGALVNMGYKPAEADRAVMAVGEPNGRPVEELLREALSSLSGR